MPFPMRVRFWGVRGSTPTPQAENLKFGGNTSCVEITTPSGESLIFDAGLTDICERCWRKDHEQEH